MKPVLAALRVARQALCALSRNGCGHNSVSRLLTGRRGNDGRIFLQAPTHRTVPSGARRQSCRVTLGAQRCLGRTKSLRACENAAPLVQWQRLSANMRIPSSLGSAMRALIHCSGWMRTTGRRPHKPFIRVAACIKGAAGLCHISGFY